MSSNRAPPDPEKKASNYVQSLKQVSRRHLAGANRSNFVLDSICNEIANATPLPLSPAYQKYIAVRPSRRGDPESLTERLHCAYLLSLAFQAIDLNVHNDDAFARILHAYSGNSSLPENTREQGRQCLARYLVSSRDDHNIVLNANKALQLAYGNLSRSNDPYVSHLALSQMIKDLEVLSPAIINNAAAQTLADLCEDYEAQRSQIAGVLLLLETAPRIDDGVLLPDDQRLYGPKRQDNIVH